MSVDSEVTGEYVMLDGESHYRITNSHALPEFFMSLVGSSDHWMFISSNGALTAGRGDPDSALFPYAADDQISVARSHTGSITSIRLQSSSGEAADVWEPFSVARSDGRRRNLYKTPLGNKLTFEEICERRQLAFRYRWTFSERFGFVRSCCLENLALVPQSLDVLDGLRNLLPYGVGSEFMMRFSNLANAYKRNELLQETGLGMFYLSSIPTDRAEPSEGLKATTVWQVGLTPEVTLLSSEQFPAFLQGDSLESELDVRGRAGAYLAKQSLTLAPGESLHWHVVAELAQDHADIVNLDAWLQETADPAAELTADIDAGQKEFLRIVSSADALQCGANARRCNRHLSNTVFNVMRGGVPLEDYQVSAADFREHVAAFNRIVAREQAGLLADLPETLDTAELRSRVGASGDPDLERLTREYLPLAFSRRHGDPTRPWNRFSIRLRSEDGRSNLNYQGNWRDIFQNWEALAVSFPEFTTAMICRFVNATTADGYNPYRLTKDGFEWEEPAPEDPWANIGYWGDHQIIYLLKLLEWNQRVDPQGLDALLASQTFVHANIPYRIKSFEEIKRNSQDTIDFDAEMSRTISARVSELGCDGKLLRDQGDGIHRVTLFEKLLTLSLAKLSNFVPDGGIWLNTQRPEWNDANNALVGNGLSMVTACYLHRWFDFLQTWLAGQSGNAYPVSQEVADFFERISEILSEHLETLGGASSLQRTQMVEALSQAGSDYRSALYERGHSGETVKLSAEGCLDFIEQARNHLAATIRNNRRPDGLYHAYNLLDWRDDNVEIEPLYEMLEGQVAVLSSKLLQPSEAVRLLTALRLSALYRENQQSYLLYPDRQLPRFLEKNVLSSETVAASPLLSRLLDEGNDQIVRRDVRGGVHFNGAFRSSSDLRNALASLDDKYRPAVEEEGDDLSRSFEELFAHRQFTGRSGTFFAYEGLGSIYWHMVSKLAQAVSENFFAAVDAGTDEKVIVALREHYREICLGIGAEKTPKEYGAFPSDPYSHTPENAGVKQPGMTGQVKEDILSRFVEVGVEVADGRIGFRFDLFDRSELLAESQEFEFIDLSGEFRTIEVPAGGFSFTLCQVPVVCQLGAREHITVQFVGGSERSVDGLKIDAELSGQLFSRTGEILSIHCEFKAP